MLQRDFNASLLSSGGELLSWMIPACCSAARVAANCTDWRRSALHRKISEIVRCTERTMCGEGETATLFTCSLPSVLFLPEA